MKSIIFIAAVFLVAGCGQTSQTNSAIKLAKYAPDVLDSLCHLTVDRNSGAFVSVDEAWGKLKLYKEHMAKIDPTYDPTKDVYGFMFGLDRMRMLINKMDSVNSLYKKDSLISVRIYFARTRKADGTEIADVFLIPTGKNKRNMYPVDDNYQPKMTTGGGTLIVNTSVPCPNQCN